jgi:hypothetical protein
MIKFWDLSLGFYGSSLSLWGSYGKRDARKTSGERVAQSPMEAIKEEEETHAVGRSAHEEAK